MLIVVALCMLLPLIICGASVLHYSTQVNRRNVRRNAELAVEMLAESVADILENTQSMLMNYTLERNSPIMYYSSTGANMSSAEYYSSQRDILTRFQNAMNGTSCLRELAMIHLRLQTVLSTASGVREPWLVSQEALLRALSASDALLFRVEDHLFVIQKYPYSSANRRPEFLLIAEFSEEYLRSLLASGAYPGAPAMLQAGGQTLCSTHPDAQIERVSENIYRVNGEKCVLYQAECAQTGVSALKYLPYAQTFGVSDRIAAFVLVYLLIGVPAYTVYVLYVRRSVHRPIVELQRAFGQISQGNLNVRLQERQAISDFSQLNAAFNSMAQQLKNVKQSEMRARQFSAEMELKHLQSQINPHFLYNAFYALKYQIQSGCLSNAEQMAEYMGGFFRYITRTARTQVPLSEEYAHALCYLNIQKLRFGQALQLETRPPEGPDGEILVPRLILQPLIENVFQHGRNTRENEPTVVRLYFERRGETLYCFVCDNGNTLSGETLRKMQAQLALHDIREETTGMVNIHRRLHLFFGGRSGMTLWRNEMGGLSVQLTLCAPRTREKKESG